MICQLRDSGLCAAVDRILARRPDRSRKPSSEESPPSPHVSLSDVTRHSPRRDASQQAKAPRRWAILSVLSRDCRLLRATGDSRRRFAILSELCVSARETRLCRCFQLQEKRTAKPRARPSAASGGQSREEFFAGRRAGRRANSPWRFRAKAKDARSVHLGDGLSAGAREKPRSGLLPAASCRADGPGDALELQPPIPPGRGRAARRRRRHTGRRATSARPSAARSRTSCRGRRARRTAGAGSAPWRASSCRPTAPTS